MEKYVRFLNKVSFPCTSSEYSNLILSLVIDPIDEGIDKGTSTKLRNIKFRFGEAILATIKFISTIPNGEKDFPKFVVGLVEYVGKLKEYATRKLSHNERMIVEYVAVLYRDNGYKAWPSQEELRERLPTALSDNDFYQTCDSFAKLECMEFNNGEIKIIEDIDILYK